MSDHECVFPEEQEPAGRLILAPCLTCGTTALDALGQMKNRIAELERGDIPADAMLLSRVEIVRYLDGDDDVTVSQAVDGQGDVLPLVEALGLLRLTEDTVIRQRMGEVPGDE